MASSSMAGAGMSMSGMYYDPKAKVTTKSSGGSGTPAGATAGLGSAKAQAAATKLPTAATAKQAAATKTTTPSLGTTLQSTYEKRKAESQAKINDVYNKQLAARQQELQTAYDKNLSDRQAALDQISPQYQNQANALAVQYEKTRRNANMNAMQSGLNTGTAIQQQNALNHNYIGNYTDLRDREAAALTDARRGITDLTTAYRNNLEQARADVDTKRNAALVEDQQKQQQWFDTQAATLAQYGDFSGYEKLYGKKQAKQMKNMWISQNPIQAYRMGYLNADQFRKVTGRDISEVGFGDTYATAYSKLGG